MKKAVIFIFVLSLLGGCKGWDEAEERAACAKSYPADPAKADECYKENLAKYYEMTRPGIKN
jgi:hypothetical protein